MNYTTNLHLPLYSSSDYDSVYVYGFIQAICGADVVLPDVTAFVAIDTAIGTINTSIASLQTDKQGKLTVNPTTQETDPALNALTIDGTIYRIEGGGGAITVDSDLSLISENPVQNKIITAALNDKIDESEVTELTLTVSESYSQSASAITAKSFTLTSDGVPTIYNFPNVEAIIQEDSTDLAVSTTESSDPLAVDAYSIQVDTDIYNLRDGRLPGLLTVGYNYATPVASGDVIADAGLIAAYTAHMPITINGMLLSYQTTSGNLVRYLTATLNNSNVHLNIVDFNTSTNVVTFHETDVLTSTDIQAMIDASIGNALNATY